MFRVLQGRHAYSAILLRSLQVVVPGFCYGAGCTLYGRPVVSVVRGARVELMDRVVLASSSRHTALGVNHPVVLRALLPGARLSIGSDTGLSGGSFCAATKISIGAGCLIGANVLVTDTEFHPVSAVGRRHLPIPCPRPEDAVVIGNDVFVGSGAVILRGSQIGDHSVVGASSLVKGHFGSSVIIAGNPARVVGPVGTRFPSDKIWC